MDVDITTLPNGRTSLAENDITLDRWRRGGEPARSLPAESPAVSEGSDNDGIEFGECLPEGRFEAPRVLDEIERPIPVLVGVKIAGDELHHLWMAVGESFSQTLVGVERLI